MHYVFFTGAASVLGDGAYLALILDAHFPFGFNQQQFGSNHF
jgi:hypothetical protein